MRSLKQMFCAFLDNKVSSKKSDCYSLLSETVAVGDIWLDGAGGG